MINVISLFAVNGWNSSMHIQPTQRPACTVCLM